MNLYTYQYLTDYIFWGFLFLGVGAFRNVIRRKRPDLPINVVTLGIVYHFLVVVAFYVFTFLGPSDAKRYFNDATNAIGWENLFGLGTSFISFLVYPMLHFLGLHYFSCFLVFGCLSFVGIFLIYLRLYGDCKSIQMKRYLNLLWFIPGLHFWTSFIGKDALIIFGLGLIFYFLPAFNTRWAFVLMGIGIVFFPRPHIALFVLISFFLVFFVKANVRFIYKFIVAVFCVGVGFYGLKFALSTVGLDLSSMGSLKAVFLNREMIFEGKGSSYNMMGKGVFLKSLAFLFKPLFFDAGSLIQLMASVENAVLAILSLRLLNIRIFKFLFLQKGMEVGFHFVYFVITTSALGMMIFNMGLAMRQKMMVVPSLLILIFLFENWKERSSCQKNHSC